MANSSAATTFTLTYILLILLPHVQYVRALSPLGKLEQDILASNMTSEEKFKARLLLWHRSYCRTSRFCETDVAAKDRCDYCAPCQCDDACFRFGDCCPDKLLKHEDQVPPLEVKLECHNNLYRGYKPQQRQARLPNATRYYLTSSCPANASPKLQQKCGNASLFVPVSVTVDDDAGHVDVFANKYCAQCHGASAADTTDWKLKVQCQSGRNFSLDAGVSDMIRKTADDDACFLVYHPPPYLPQPRQCYFDDHMISECNVTGEWPARDEFVQRACGAYLDPKWIHDTVFKNPFCFLCNADPTLRATQKLLYGFCPNHVGLSPMPFSALVDFYDAIYSVEEQSASSQCRDSEIYDAEKDQCRLVLCSQGRQYRKGNCSVVLHSALGLAYSLSFGMTSQTELRLDVNDTLHKLPESLADAVMQLLDFKTRNKKFVVTFDTTDPKGRCSDSARSLTVYTTLVVAQAVDVDELEQMLLSLRNTSISVPVASTWVNLTTQPGDSVPERLQKPGKKAAGGSCAVSYSQESNALDGDEDLVFTEVNDLLLMPQVALQQDEFVFVKATDGLRVAWLEEEISSQRYQTVDGTVRILLGDFLPKLEAYRRTRRTPQEAEILLSVVCTSLSLAGLAVTFLTYAVFRPLRTAPGKNNMNLCLALFLAQLLYLVGSGRTEVPGLCQAMGILIHYAWLAAFAAMSVCSFHMWRVFTSLTVAHDSHNDNGQRRLQLYTVYIWGAAAAVVVVTLMVHLVVTGGDSIGYGGQYCYLTTPLGIGLAMGAPVVMVVLANAVFFFLTVHTIRRSPRVTKSRQDEQHVWVYLKLSTLTGITWTLAFLIFFTEVKAIEYAFTVVNGLQGIFICVSFVLNRRVMALYVACFKGDYSGLTSSVSGTMQRTSSGSNHTQMTSTTDSVKT